MGKKADVAGGHDGAETRGGDSAYGDPVSGDEPDVVSEPDIHSISAVHNEEIVSQRPHVSYGRFELHRQTVCRLSVGKCNHLLHAGERGWALSQTERFSQNRQAGENESKEKATSHEAGSGPSTRKCRLGPNCKHICFIGAFSGWDTLI